MKFILYSLLFLLIFNIAYPQNEKGSFNLNGIILFPTGDFRNEEGGSAKTGFGVELNYSYPINSPGFSLETSLSILYNGYDLAGVEQRYKDEYEEYSSEVSADVINSGNWFNLPLFTGLRYKTDLSPTLEAYGISQIGINFVSVPDALVNIQ